MKLKIERENRTNQAFTVNIFSDVGDSVKKSTKWRFSSLSHQNFGVFGQVPKSNTHTGLICVKTPEPNIPCLGPFNNRQKDVQYCNSPLHEHAQQCGARGTFRVLATEHIFYCKRAILFISSSKILTPHPPLRPASLYSPRNKGGYSLAGRRGGWGVNILEDERNRIALLQ
jgi:hypothetical protein